MMKFSNHGCMNLIAIHDISRSKINSFIIFYVLYREQVYSSRNNNSSLSNDKDLNAKVLSSNVSLSSCLDNIEGMKSKNNEV